MRLLVAVDGSAGSEQTARLVRTDVAQDLVLVSETSVMMVRARRPGAGRP